MAVPRERQRFAPPQVARNNWPLFPGKASENTRCSVRNEVTASYTETSSAGSQRILQLVRIVPRIASARRQGQKFALFHGDAAAQILHTVLMLTAAYLIQPYFVLMAIATHCCKTAVRPRWCGPAVSTPALLTLTLGGAQNWATRPTSANCMLAFRSGQRVRSGELARVQRGPKTASPHNRFVSPLALCTAP